MDNSGITDKVYFLLNLSKQKKYSRDELNDVISFIPLHSNNLTLGKVFGYSVSDYAFATLFWLGTSETLNLFNVLSKEISAERALVINELIEKNCMNNVNRPQ